MSELADQHVRDRTAGRGPAGLDETLFVEAGAGSGKTRALVDRVEALVAAGVEVRHIAAITFTEKAAAELRQRIRARLADRAAATSGAGAERWLEAVAQVDVAAIGTLHAFAQRILGDRPLEAGLPPRLRVMDEVASLVAFQDRWHDLRRALLDDEDLERSLGLAMAAGLRMDDLRHLARAFDANWDLVEERVALDVPDPEPVVAGALGAELEAVAGLIAGCENPGKNLHKMLSVIDEYGQRLDDAADERELLAVLRAPKPTFRPGRTPSRTDPSGVDLGELGERVRGLGDLRTRVVDGVVDQVVRRLAAAVGRATLTAAEERRSSGRLEFHDLLVLARRLLRGPHGSDTRRALRGRYRRLLLDEFQDTDPIQIELAALLAAAPRDGDTDLTWHDLEPDPGRLFLVGDPKQSVYRFRRADIALFLKARERYADPPAVLSTNFRSAPTVLAWVNHVFGRVVVPRDDAQPAYSPLAPAPGRDDPPVGPTVTVLGHDAHPDTMTADELKAAEASDVVATVTAALEEGWSVRDAAGGWRPARPGDIAILLPTRTSLPALELALEDAGVPYRAETSALVYQTPEVRELFAALRAVADPSDGLSLVTALRSSLFGCGDDDLVVYARRHGGALDMLADPPPGLRDDHPVVESLRWLRGVHEDAVWRTPSELLDRMVRERRVLELGLAHGRPRDLWRRIRYVVDQARAWDESEGGTLRHYLAWVAMQGSEAPSAAEPVLPETDDDAVRILTVHGAKGLEFPIAVLSGTNAVPGGRRRGVTVAWPPKGEPAISFGARLTTPGFERFQPKDDELAHHERVRLLYVACTRAEDHLVVSLHRNRSRPPDEHAKWTHAEILVSGCLGEDDAPGQTVVVPRARPFPARVDTEVEELPAFDDWAAERAAVLTRAGHPHVVAATDVAGLRLDGDDPGLARDPNDLAGPPSLRGHYGAAVGRAVHAVLQTIDLATGETLVEAAAAQAAAEGVADKADEVAALARAALGSDVVRAAAASGPERETYVAAPVGGVLVEGYVDLLYRGDDGLVVVDYKTAGDDGDLDARAGVYRLQVAAYAAALRAATGERVARCVLCFLTPSGAHERDIGDVDAAIADVERVLAARRAEVTAGNGAA